MSEKPPVFTVTDRRKFTMDGELRDDAAAETRHEEPKAPAVPESTKPASKPEAEPEAANGPKVVTMPTPKDPGTEAVSEPVKAAEDLEPTSGDEAVPPVSAQDEAAARSAYQRSSDHIETMLRAANPGAEAQPAVSFEHVIQSIYLSAIVALGAAAEPGQKAQIDVLGARQSIDMLGVLEGKTKGNLSEKEQRLLQNALFETRMMFLEITNALAQQAAQRPPQGKK